MNVNERLNALERSAGKGDHDLLLKLDALSRQLAHQEGLIKQLEDANQDRYRKLWREIDWLPRGFKGHLRLPFGFLLEVQLFPRALNKDLYPESERPAFGFDLASGEDRTAYVLRPSAVHEKPRP
jgi:hypothetical protein